MICVIIVNLIGCLRPDREYWEIKELPHFVATLNYLIFLKRSFCFLNDYILISLNLSSKIWRHFEQEFDNLFS